MPRKTNEVKYIDLFAGLGGIRLGLEQALAERGMTGRCVFTAEIKKSALVALNRNFPGENIKETNIRKVKSSSLRRFNILLGGFPCQAFSSAGKQMGLADTRGTLFFEVARILQDRLQDVDGFILENVEGLVTHDRENNTDKEGRTIQTIMNVLTNDLGYNAQYVVLNAADFGIPQKRKRVYIVGCKKKFGKIDLQFVPIQHVGVGLFLEKGLPCLDNDFSKSLLRKYKPQQLLGKSLKDKRGGANNIHSWDINHKGPVTNQEKQFLNILLKERRKRSWADIIGITWMDGMPLTADQIRTFYDVPNLQELLDDLVEKKYLTLEYPRQQKVQSDDRGHTYYTRIPDVTKPKGYNIVTGKLSFEISKILNPEVPCNTLVAMDMSTNGVVDGNGIRHLTLREGLRFFGYPEDYSLEDFESPKKIKEGYDLIGNSVCVPVIKAIANRLLDCIYPKGVVNE